MPAKERSTRKHIKKASKDLSGGFEETDEGIPEPEDELDTADPAGTSATPTKSEGVKLEMTPG